MNNKTNFDELIKYSVFNTYPDYAIDEILDILEKKKMIKTKKRISNKNTDVKEDGVVDVSAIIKSKDKLNYFLEYNKEFDLSAFILNYEWDKGFRHAVLLEIEGFNVNTLNKCIEKGNIIDVKFEKSSNVSEYISNPILNKNGEGYVLKFPLVKKGIINDDKIIHIKYPVIVVIDSINNLIEIRFDKIKTIFQQTKKNFYEDLIKGIVGWLKSFLELNTKQVELKPQIQKIIDEYNENMEEAEVIPMKRDVALKSGSKVVLDIDANKNFIVPILGDLKFIMKSYEDELKNIPLLKQELEKLIKTVEEGDVPKLSLYWRKVGIMVGITHGYKESEYSLFHYYGEIKDSRMMDYVRKYFKNNRAKDSGK